MLTSFAGKIQLRKKNPLCSFDDSICACRKHDLKDLQAFDISWLMSRVQHSYRAAVAAWQRTLGLRHPALSVLLINYICFGNWIKTPSGESLGGVIPGQSSCWWYRIKGRRWFGSSLLKQKLTGKGQKLTVPHIIMWSHTRNVRGPSIFPLGEFRG